jgi:hypothetical protein
MQLCFTVCYPLVDQHVAARHFRSPSNEIRFSA